MRRLLLLGTVAALLAAPGTNAAPPVLEHGVFAGSQPPAPPFGPASPIKSFKIEILPL